MRKKEKNNLRSSSNSTSNTQSHQAGDGSSSSISHRNKNGSQQNKSWYWNLLLLDHGDRPSVLWLLLYVLFGVILGMILGSSHFLGGDTMKGSNSRWSQRLRDSLFRRNRRRQRRQDPSWVPPTAHSPSASTSTTKGTIVIGNGIPSTKGNSEEYDQILRALVEGGEIIREEEEIGYTIASSAGAGGNTRRIWQQNPGSTTYAASTTNYYNRQQQQHQRTIFPKASSLPVVQRTYSQAYYVLRESIIREDYGYVHSDLGFLIPAPCGAERGLGMVSSRYHECQVTCSPGSSQALTRPSKPSSTNNNTTDGSHTNNSTSPSTAATVYHLPKGWFPQEEILLRIPLSIQITRFTALKKLRSLLPPEVESRAPLEDLDDSILLTLQLAHEHGCGRESPWHSYIATLPLTNQCGYAPNLRTSALDVISTMGEQYGLDVNGWPAELHRAFNYADQIVSSLTQTYGPYIATAKGVNVHSVLHWSLCHVSSHAIGGRELDPRTGQPIVGRTKKKSLRLVPLLDLINHDVTAGMAHELLPISKKKNSSLPWEDGVHYNNIQENERGAFVIRNMRHGKPLPLTKGQELLINYNIPEYSALDWFLLMSFVPPERMDRWVKLESAFPRVRLQPRGIGSNEDEASM